jgi:hypothetical protein
MSCLYLNLELINDDCCGYAHRCGTRSAHTKSQCIHSASILLTFFKKSRSTRRVPQASIQRRQNQIMQPAKTGFSREFPGAISGFRSLCGREQRSTLSHRAQSNCLLEPFARDGFSL